MTGLENINFYHTYKKRRGGRKPNPKWKRSVTKSIGFEQKVNEIKKRAEYINQKLKTA